MIEVQVKQCFARINIATCCANMLHKLRKVILATWYCYYSMFANQLSYKFRISFHTTLGNIGTLIFFFFRETQTDDKFNNTPND